MVGRAHTRGTQARKPQARPRLAETPDRVVGHDRPAITGPVEPLVLTPHDLPPTHLRALTAYGEARNQPIMGIVAVLSVITNRLVLQRWGLTYQDVCLAPLQFSCWNASDPNSVELNQLAQRILTQQALPYNPVWDACLSLAGRDDLRDVTGSATHYFAPALVHPPAWSDPPAIRTTIIAGHAFYKGVR